MKIGRSSREADEGAGAPPAIGGESKKGRRARKNADAAPEKTPRGRRARKNADAAPEKTPRGRRAPKNAEAAPLVERSEAERIAAKKKLRSQLITAAVIVALAWGGGFLSLIQPNMAKEERAKRIVAELEAKAELNVNPLSAVPSAESADRTTRVISEAAGPVVIAEISGPVEGTAVAGVISQDYTVDVRGKLTDIATFVGALENKVRKEGDEYRGGPGARIIAIPDYELTVTGDQGAGKITVRVFVRASS